MKIKTKFQDEGISKRTISLEDQQKLMLEGKEIEEAWATINEDKFEELIQKLSPLMKYRESVIRLAPEKFNPKDLVAEKEFIEFGPQHEALSEDFLRKVYNHRKAALVQFIKIESPFTMLHPEGIRGIFNKKDIDEIIDLTNKVLAA